ncbi:MAG: MBL fold metallo-hydrolase [Clostridiales bacterium]|nr:MBL fold metallo-hydrolase [Clostridiales bacterium]
MDLARDHRPERRSGIREILREKIRFCHPKRNAWVGYIICMDGIRYYYSGDSDATKEAKTVDCDVAFIPIGGTYTTNARDAAEWVNAIKPAVVVPVHYGSIVGKLQDADVFKERVSDDIQVVIKITGE